MKKVGRPKGTNNKDVTISMRMDKATKARLEAYCEKMHIAKSEALRQAIALLTADLDKEQQELEKVLGFQYLFYNYEKI